MKKLSILWVLIILFEYYYKVCFGCLKEERDGLLKIKPFLGNPFYKTDPFLAWVDNENSDCCGWEFVKCDNNTRRVIQLNFQTTFLKHGEFHQIDAVLFLPFQQLQFLDLSSNWFSDLQNSQALRSLKKLQVLLLSQNNINNTRIFQTLSTLTSLTVLGLSSNQINGSLSDLARELCKLKNIKELYLSDNMLSGSIPACFNNLTSLKALDLSHNQLSGNLHSSFLVTLNRLEYFSLNGNMYDGSLMFNTLVDREFHFKLLGLSNCNLNVSTTHLVEFLHNQPLIGLDLSHNNLHGEFPNSLFENNSNLKILNLKNNSLTGHIHFPVGSLVNLVSLDVSHNHIQGKFQPNIGEVLPKLRDLKMANNDLQGEIPLSLRNMKNLEFLDLSNNNLSGKLPERLDLNCERLGSIQLSNNRLEGQLYDTLFNLTYLTTLDLSNNEFSGNIPSNNFKAFYLRIFDISQNHISGRIPLWLGNLTNSIDILLMHNNSIEGHIPPELCNLTYLQHLDLSRNQLSGLMPSCLTTLPSLRYLHLRHNKFTGLLPKALPLNTSNLLTLDLSYNTLFGKIPIWFGFLLDLRVLLLKGNRFSGSIPRELCRLHKIGIMDLSHNNLSGSIPLCFTNITFGRVAIDEKRYFSAAQGPISHTFLDEVMFPNLIIQSVLDDEADLVYKQTEIEFMIKSRSNSYKGGIINYMSGMDLSSNNLKGNIPLDIGALTDLRALNLSHNQFTGVIPPSLSNMKQIESIDLSHNILSGDIPSSLTRLSFLVTFIVAYNNLSGRVPEMIAQFSTFGEASYKGNPFLCGPPLLGKQCNNNTDQATITDTLASRIDLFGIDPISFLASFIATYVTCLLGFIIVLYINPYWRRRWFHFIDACLSFVFPSW